MKILFIIPALTVGGAEKLVVDLLCSMIRRGEDVSLLVLKDTDTFFNNLLSEAGVPVFSFNMDSVYSFKTILKVKTYLKEFDIVHVHLFPTLYWVALSKLFRFGARAKAKLVYTEHSTHNKRRDKWFFRLPERFIYGRYNQIVSITDNVKKYLAEWLGYKNDNDFITTIENGIDLCPFNNSESYSRDELGLPENSIVLFMAGRFVKAKDQQTVIRALKVLDDKNVFLLFAGTGELMSQSESLAEKLGLKDQVKFLGLRSDIPCLMKSANICILSSNWEGLPLVLVEYMASNKPVIGSNVPGIKDLIHDCGLLFEKGNEKSLAHQINLLLNSLDEYKRIQDMCYKKAEAYSIEKTIDNYLEVYKTL